MNMMMLVSVTGQGAGPSLSSHGMLFSFFLAAAGIMLLSAAALLARREEPRQAVRCAASRTALRSSSKG